MTCHRFNGTHVWGTKADHDRFYAAVERAAYVQWKRVQEESRKRREAQAAAMQLVLGL